MAETDGIRVGKRGSFHPKLYLNGGFDSNVFNRSGVSQVSSGSTLGDIITAPYFNVRPGLMLRLPSRSVDFNVGGYVNYSMYFSDRTSSLNQFTGKGDLELTFLPNGPFQIKIANYFSRNTGDPFNSTDVFDRVYFYYDGGNSLGGVFLTLNNSSLAQFTIQPGGGAFRIDLSYRFNFGIFPSPDMDNFRHQIGLSSRWNFFPKTALTFDANFDIVRFAPNFDTSNQSGVNANSTPLKVYLGLSGRFTERLVLNVRVGGGYTFTDSSDPRNQTQDDYGMVLGSLDLTYYLTYTTYIRVGFRHDFEPSFFSNYFTELMGSLEFASQLGRFLISLRGDAGQLAFGKIPQRLGGTVFNSQDINADNTINRADLVVRGTLSLEVRAQEWLIFGLQGRVVWRDSNTFAVVNQDQFGLGFFKAEALFKTEVAF